MRKLQVKVGMQYITWTKMAIIKKLVITSVEKDVEKIQTFKGQRDSAPGRVFPCTQPIVFNP